MSFEDPGGTAVGEYLKKLSNQHPGQSGFAIIRNGRPAFTDRVALTELAEKSLHLQYYIWEADATGRILAERLVRAADRGVRVRILVDDINLKGRDAVVAALDAHPNIEIRLFNPFTNRRMRELNFLTDFNRVNHRMHNKVMVMDNAVAIVGGRNIGDHPLSSPEAEQQEGNRSERQPLMQSISFCSSRERSILVRRENRPAICNREACHSGTY